MVQHGHNGAMTTGDVPGTVHRSGWAVLAFGALGVVFGDIGTSPLYAVQTVFSIDHGDVKATALDVFGVISLVFWSVTVVVSVKYVAFILRADNQGEGGIMALAALTRQVVRRGGRRWTAVMLLGVLGASLFYGDSVITPAISVMSAIEGLTVVDPTFTRWEVLLGALVIIGLFSVQRHGTAKVGRFFGPVMALWFLSIGALGVGQLVKDPSIIKGLSPSYALAFFVERPGAAFVAMGAVVLSITGAEALYADMGHFGRVPITRAWFGVVFPCLVLNYLGQGSLILEKPASVSNPFFILAPQWSQLPLVLLATAATVIASQSVISGAFSVSRQAERLDYLPRLTVLQTSKHEGGQIYVPAINWILFIGVMFLLVTFKSSNRLATAYGLAVTGTFILTSALFLVYAHAKGWRTWQLVALGVPLLTLELTYFAANVTKILTGGWLPLLIALVVCTVMLTWQRGRTVVVEQRMGKEGRLDRFLEYVAEQRIPRAPGAAVYLHSSPLTTPLALRENARFNHVVHERVVIVKMEMVNVPTVPRNERVAVVRLKAPDGTFSRVNLRFGFSEDPNVPAALAHAREDGLLDIDPDTAIYFLSRISVGYLRGVGMPVWRKRLFLGLAHNAADPTGYFRLPEDRTVVMGAEVKM